MSVHVNSVKRNNCLLSPACFTFVREPVYHEPSEVVRMAGVRSDIAGRRHRAHTVLGVSCSQSSLSSSSSASDLREPSTDSKPPAQPHPPVDVNTETPLTMSEQSFNIFIYYISLILFCVNFFAMAKWSCE